MNGIIRQIASAWLLVILGGGAARASQPLIHHEPITVRVLDGRRGGPVAAVHLILIAGYDERDLHLRLWQEEAVTDAAGSAQVPDSLVSFPYLQVVVARHRMCIGDVYSSRFSMDQIRFGGLNSPNRCGVFTVENLSGVFVVFAKIKGSDRPPVKDPQPQSAETNPVAVAPVSPISTLSLVKPPVFPVTATERAVPISSSSVDVSSSMSGPAQVPLLSHRIMPPQSFDTRGATISTPATTALLQHDSTAAGDGLFLEEESARLLEARPEPADWSESMCQQYRPQ